ncbi:hypothetical protein Hanom_Chr01g00053951 [Helianthus anomalus]
MYISKVMSKKRLMCEMSSPKIRLMCISGPQHMFILRLIVTNIGQSTCISRFIYF